MQGGGSRDPIPAWAALLARFVENTSMKKVDAIIRPSCLDAVQEALERRGIGGLTLTEVAGSGHEPGHTASYRGATYAVDSHPRIRVEIVVPDADAVPVAEAVARAARTGRPGDGLVSIVPVLEAVRIRTGEHGHAAVSDAGEHAHIAPASRSADRGRAPTLP